MPENWHSLVFFPLMKDSENKKVFIQPRRTTPCLHLRVAELVPCCTESREGYHCILGNRQRAVLFTVAFARKYKHVAKCAAGADSGPCLNHVGTEKLAHAWLAHTHADAKICWHTEELVRNISRSVKRTLLWTEKETASMNTHRGQTARWLRRNAWPPKPGNLLQCGLQREWLSTARRCVEDRCNHKIRLFPTASWLVGLYIERGRCQEG